MKYISSENGIHKVKHNENEYQIYLTKSLGFMCIHNHHYNDLSKEKQDNINDVHIWYILSDYYNFEYVDSHFFHVYIPKDEFALNFMKILMLYGSSLHIKNKPHNGKYLIFSEESLKYDVFDCYTMLFIKQNKYMSIHDYFIKNYKKLFSDDKSINNKILLMMVKYCKHYDLHAILNYIIKTYKIPELMTIF